MQIPSPAAGGRARHETDHSICTVGDVRPSQIYLVPASMGWIIPHDLMSGL